MSVIIHDVSVIIHDVSVIIHDVSVIIHDVSVIIHDVSVIIHDVSVIIRRNTRTHLGTTTVFDSTDWEGLFFYASLLFSMMPLPHTIYTVI